MRNSKTLLITVSTIIILLGSVLLFSLAKDYNIKKASADSGFDSSWDSGGSDWDSGSSSSWDSGSSWSSDRSKSKNNSAITCDSPICLLYGVLLVGVLVTIEACCAIAYISISKDEKKNAPPKELDDNQKNLLKEYGYDENKVKEEAYDAYVKIQEAWSNNDIEKARSYLSDTLFNQYKSQIMGLIAKKQRNAMSDFYYVDSKVLSVTEENNSLIIDVKLSVSCYDYLIDTTDDKVIRGDASQKNYYIYKLSFLLSKDNIINRCPNCNAEIEDIGSSIVCKYCGANIERKSNNLVLNRKEMIEQH